MNNKDRKNTLSLFGGDKLIKHPFEHYNSMGQEEVLAATEVVESGVLSQFLGRWGEDFLGGPTTGWWIDEALDITLDARRDAL